MKLSPIFKATFVLFFAFGCKEEPEEIKLHPHYKKSNQSDTDPTISTNFNENVFQFGVEEKLLKELHLCDPKAETDNDPKHPSCSPKFFRFFKLSEKSSLENGFMVLIKAGVNDFPLRRLLIFERENGTLVKLNGFNGNLIEQRKTTSGYDDLVIRFPDNINGNITYYNCVFTWKNGKYEYVNCEVIDEDIPRRIKAEFVDSMAVEIKKILDRNKMIF
ncbi:MAG TPA: hypothetical protein PLI97_02490 [Fluviicola sp.]|nr:hypothetical protein [Fluviicola sp.]